MPDENAVAEDAVIENDLNTDENLEPKIEEKKGAIFDGGDEDPVEPNPEPEEKKFTQTDLNHHIKERLKREKEIASAIEAEKAKLQEERDALLKKYEPGDEFLELPELPDELDDDYENKKKVYEALKERKLKALGKAEALQEIREKEELQTQQAEQAKHKEKVEADQAKFTENGKKFGLSEQTVKDIDGIFTPEQYMPNVAGYVINEPKGMLVGEFLAKNPAEVAKILKMEPYQQIKYIINEIEPKVKHKPIKKPPNEVVGDTPSYSGEKRKGRGNKYE